MLRRSPRPMAHPEFNRPMFTNPDPCISEAPTHIPAASPRSLLGESLAVSAPAGASQSVPDAQSGPQAAITVERGAVRRHSYLLRTTRPQAAWFRPELWKQDVWEILAAKCREVNHKTLLSWGPRPFCLSVLHSVCVCVCVCAASWAHAHTPFPKAQPPCNNPITLNNSQDPGRNTSLLIGQNTGHSWCCNEHTFSMWESNSALTWTLFIISFSTESVSDIWITRTAC